MSRVDELSDMITPLIAKSNYRLWDLGITKAAKRSIVTVTLDKDGGANLDEMAEISKEIALVIDEHPSFDSEYHLEVESPGLERSLTRPEHYQWSKDMLITVSYRDGDALSRSRGILTNVNEDEIVIKEVPQNIKRGSRKQIEVVVDQDEEPKFTNIAIETITKAHTVFDFEQAMKRETEKSLKESENI
jgi:ribosome maturation factor RimP